MVLCSICLRTSPTLDSVSQDLICFYDNLIDHEMFSNLSVCATCKQLLERCYDFKQLCQGSNRVLQDWKKKKKKEIFIENLHTLIKPYYDKVKETNDEKQNKTESENITILFVTNNENVIPNNIDEIEFNGNNGKGIDDDTAQNLEGIIRNYENLFQRNNILTDSIEPSQLYFPIEPCKEMNLNLSYNEHTGIGDNTYNDHNKIEVNEHNRITDNNDNEHNSIAHNSDNEHNGIAHNNDNERNRITDNNDNEHNSIAHDSDNEHNGIEDNSDNEHNRIADNSGVECNGIENNSYIENNTIGDDSDIDSDSDSDDSSYDLEFIKRLLRNAKNKTVEMIKTNETIKEEIEEKKKALERKPFQNMENYKSVFDIVLFATDEEAKRDLLERPSTDYYRNATAKCTICYSVFKSLKYVDYHMKWHDPSAGDHVCDICEMRFKKKRRAYTHKINCHFARYSCKMCPLVTYHTSVMMTHTRLHQGILNTCKYCGATYRHKQNFLSHLRMYHPSIYSQTNNVCTICGRNFVSPHGLNMHRKMMHQITEDVVTESSTRCEDCDLTFVNQEAYTVHVKNTPCHKSLADPISRTSCSVCGKRFENRRSLLKHKQEHRLKKSYGRKYRGGQEMTVVTCKQCGATGENLKWLYDHCRTKHRKLPYVSSYPSEHLCEQCGKGFRLRCLLTEHQRVHTGERPFACDECGRAFITKLKLNNHTQTHKPPSKVCAVCGKKFISASNLQNHMRIHFGDRRYKCSLCDKGFLHASTLREHVRGVHQNVKRVRKPRQHKQMKIMSDISLNGIDTLGQSQLNLEV